MKLLLIGKTGQVGWELNRSLAPLGELIACDRRTADLSQPGTLASLVEHVRPDAIVNAAAYTAVDRAETEEVLAMTINGEAVGVLAKAARDVGALFIHYSTDYVFDGAKQGAYCEDDATAPLNAYGRSKLAGEQAAHACGGDWLIFRTSWVYGARGANFLRTMLRLARERDELKVVADQHGAPTSARMIADVSAHAIRQAIDERRRGEFASGTFHLTASGTTTWHGFATRIVESAHSRLPMPEVKTRSVQPIPASAYPTAARRPSNSVLDNGKIEQRFGVVMPSWESAMELVLDDVLDCESRARGN